jgi:hypothetical protein
MEEAQSLINSSVVRSPHAARSQKLNLQQVWQQINRFMPLLVLVVLALQLVTLFFFFNPPFLANQNLINQITSEVAKLTAVNPYETPTMAVVSSAEDLRKQNDIMKQVYKDAQEGDYVLAYSDKLILYRRNENKVIYQGPTPNQILNDSQAKLVAEITEAAVKAGIVKSDSEDKPQLSTVVDPAALKQQDPIFYADVQKDDIRAVFPKSEIVVVYRLATKQIVKSGKVTTTIS